jgi:hypothetical protein
LRDECEISIGEIDASTSEFHLRGIHKREIRAMAAKVRELAEKRRLSQLIKVSETTDDQDV